MTLLVKFQLRVNWIPKFSSHLSSIFFLKDDCTPSVPWVGLKSSRLSCLDDYEWMYDFMSLYTL